VLFECAIFFKNNMIHTLKTPPLIEPVTLADYREHSGIVQRDDTSRDSSIELKIKAARQWAEKTTRIAFITQTWVYENHCFESKIRLKANLQSVAFVKYLDTSGTLQTLDIAAYFVDLKNSVLFLKQDEFWPATYRQSNAVQIEYNCGFGDTPETVPDDIKEAIKFLVGHWEMHQTSMESGRLSTVPYAIEQLLDNYKDYRDYF
jgi:uncharacterized phiE125 gp8 family phage protein